MLYFHQQPPAPPQSGMCDSGSAKGADLAMELRVLQYFLTVAREQSISGAADFLHLTQPTLSRQLKDLEDELGKQLLIRGSRKVTLTEEGMLLRKRAEEILNLVHKTEIEMTLAGDAMTGEVYIGAGETDSMREVARAARRVRQDHPGVHFHLISGDRQDILEQLDRGLLDFAVVLGGVDHARYDTLPLSGQDTWGVLMRRDHPLSQKDAITPNDLHDQPLLLSRQALTDGSLTGWFQEGSTALNVAMTYNLIYNAALMVDEGIGLAMTLQKLVNTEGTKLCFRPLDPPLNIGMELVWKKYQLFSKAAEALMDQMQGHR